MPNNKMERFTQRSRRVMSLAMEYAERFQHTTIDRQHILMGLYHEEGGIAGVVLRDFGIKKDRLEELVIELSTPSQPVEGTAADLSSGSKRVLELAVDEARRMGHHFIGTEHLLLGLVRQSEGVAIDILKRLDVSPEQLRRQIRRMLQESPVQTSSAPPRPSIPLPKPPPATADNAYAVMQIFIAQVLAMITDKTLTMEQALKLFHALSPHLKLSVIEQTDLINQLFQNERLQHYKVRIRVSDPSGKEASGETLLPMTRFLTEIDTFLDMVINQPDTPFIYAQDGFTLEVRIEKGTPDDRGSDK